MVTMPVKAKSLIPLIACRMDIAFSPMSHNFFLISISPFREGLQTTTYQHSRITSMCVYVVSHAIIYNNNLLIGSDRRRGLRRTRI